MRFFHVQKTRGLTFVEVLVAVAIVAILATIVYASLGEARKKSRDAQRYSDMLNVQIALRLYKDSNGSYPSTGGAGTWWSVCPDGGSHGTTEANGYIPDLVPTYLPVLPTEPLGCSHGAGAVKGYIYSSNGTDYKFATDFTTEIGSECKPGMRFDDPNRGQGTGGFWFCSIFSPGAANW